MKIKKQYKILGEVFLFFLLIIIDQLTKYFASNNLSKGPFVIINNVFEFRYLENSGAAFGILQNKIIFFVIMTILILIIIYLIKHKINTILYNNEVLKITKFKYKFFDIILLFLAAGAIGNFIDRLRFNYVTDFIYFKLINFPIFNVADCYVSVSAFLLVFLFLFIFKEEEYNLLFPSKNKLRG